MRILFLQKRLLFPSDTGGKIRTLNVVRHLARWHDVTYLCNAQPHEQAQEMAMKELGVDLHCLPWQEPPRRSARFLASAGFNLLSPYPLNVDKDYDRDLRQTAMKMVNEKRFDLLICDFVQMARNCLGLPLPKLLFQHNVEAEIFERQAAAATGPWGSYLKLQAARMRRFEASVGSQFDGFVAVSQRDKQQFEQRYGWYNIGVIDTAVDTDYFRPAPSRRTSLSQEVVFVGSMDWQPNVDGILRFVTSIWPRVVAQLPNARLTVVGRNPTPAIRRLDGRENVRITGTVKDTRPYLNDATVNIVPLYTGGGTRLKIFESMAMNVPVISTSLGAEGLNLVDGKHLLIRDHDDEFAQAVIQLIHSPESANRLSANSSELISERYTSELIARQFEACCLSAIRAYDSRAGGHGKAAPTEPASPRDSDA